MSASTERKNRIAAREAGTDKKMIAAQEEEKKKAISRRRWTWGTIGVIALIAVILLLNSGLMYTATTALTANGVKYSPAQVNYYYGSDYLSLANQYGSYASILGLDTSMGISSLGDQECPMLEGGTWRDYFRDMAKGDVQQVRALLEYAAENGLELTEEEIADVDAQFEGIEETAKSYGYGSADKLYAMNYGSGVTKKIVRQAALDGALAQKAYDDKQASLTWPEDELAAYYDGLNGDRDLFTYDYYEVNARTVENPVTDLDEKEAAESIVSALGNGLSGEGTKDGVEMIATDESRAEAKATADAIVAAFKDGADEEDAPDEQTRFAAAVESQTGEQPEVRSAVSGSSLPSAFADWMKDSSRKAGDIAVFPSSEEDPTSYYAVVFYDHDDNHYLTANVRHILVKAAADENGEYTDEAKAAAKARAEEILAEFNAGDKTEDSFAALANQYSEDTGSNTTGGLYENVPKGQMVPEFEAFCFDSHKAGDTGIVYGESTSYAGYHVMYYVGQGELYSNNIAKTALQTEAMNTWTDELSSACTVEEGFGFRFVGK